MPESTEASSYTSKENVLAPVDTGCKMMRMKKKDSSKKPKMSSGHTTNRMTHGLALNSRAAVLGDKAIQPEKEEAKERVVDFTSRHGDPKEKEKVKENEATHIMEQMNGIKTMTMPIFGASKEKENGALEKEKTTKERSQLITATSRKERPKEKENGKETKEKNAKK